MTPTEAERRLLENGFVRKPGWDTQTRKGGTAYRCFWHPGATTMVPELEDSAIEFVTMSAIDRAQQHDMTTTLDQCT